MYVLQDRTRSYVADYKRSCDDIRRKKYIVLHRIAEKGRNMSVFLFVGYKTI